MLYMNNETLIRVHVKINSKTSVLNMKCCRELTVKLQKVFYDSQASVGVRQQYTIIFLPTILNYLNDRERGAIIVCRILRPPSSPDTTILNYHNDREGVGALLIFVGYLRPPPQTPQYLTILMTEGGIIFCRIFAPPPPP